MPDVQKPFNAPGFERIKKFLDDRLRIGVGVGSFDRELAHNKHNQKFLIFFGQNIHAYLSLICQRPR